MIKKYYISLIFLVLAVLGVFLHDATFDKTGAEKSILTISSMIHGAEPSFEVSYIEANSMEFFGTHRHNNSVYPEMAKIDRIGFVYEK